MVTASNTFTQFNALLNGHGTLGVAVSGGGDSLALLQLLAEWGRRPLHVFTVDHRINPLSAQWTEAVAQHTQRLNLPFTALTWNGAKPATGLSAAARTARHALLADAARANGIRVLCLAHTADDIAEAQAMRTAGSNVSIPRTWAPSPVWPQGRGVFLCRPLLSHRRAELREFLTDRSLAWIDDPSNDSPKSLRARTRKALAGAAPAAVPPSDQPSRAEVEILLYDPEGWADLGLLR
ncbi:MAG: tRNA lysidine(34) synthetase TilS, partial [Asticcacaulis sp.]|nr:tRNA lysidine(34) synthetase TilS [Asticcacaulis sp.]